MLDWIFAPVCIACGSAAETLCPPCKATLDPLGPACPTCAEPTGELAIICRRCRAQPPPVEHVGSPWRFGGQLEVAIKRLKFSGHTFIARSLAPLWAPLVAAAAGDDALVVPVPLHWRRRWQRGFDHAWLLALHACRFADLPPPVPALRRIRAAPPQSKLTAAERRDNLRGAFVARGVEGRAVVLVDDVITTGATASACARALIAAGATRVVAITVARATSAPG